MTRAATSIAAGTPEDIARTPASHTGRYLRPVLGLPETDAAPPPAREPAARRRGRRIVTAPSRADALALLEEWNANPSLRKHGLLVEAGRARLRGG